MSRKTTISTFSFTIIFILSVLLTGCKKKNQKEISTTPILPPTHGPVITLDSLKHWYYMNCGPNDTLRITNDFTIEGIVVSNDKSGNIYKTLYIQDSTGGITLLLDQVNLFNLFPPGHKVFVKCKDLYFGTDGSFIKLGSLFYGHVGMIPSDKIQSHVYPDGLPDQPFQPKNR